MWRPDYEGEKKQKAPKSFHLGRLIFKWKILNLLAKRHKLIANAPFGKKKKKNLWRTSTYFYPQYAASATLSGHIGPNKEKKKYNIFGKKAEKARGAQGGEERLR